ncbi:alpha-ribazole phosphatase [Palleronia marisminoris]|uniref:Bifunctional RNase H/acid phosphatase n=1 Tax=Palleronia marisminoris TaxID=315423 RepID=A0A1Y5SK80_9RHOB|nr:histidine phosphatase family protein [Palleronia marisminoris]SFG84667.1 alpha-ribazole phosphatase [Palleronia marisminoris]SLN42063.1 bifunctional RNase H/acid phosphatase [Palleronia marisminoris]
MPRPDLLFIRHAAVTDPTRLWGRSEVDTVPDPASIAAMRAMLGEVATVVSSPARRCTRTARALFPEADVAEDPRLWEQDFGCHDGAPLADLPDLGPLTGDALAAHRWEGGESFAELCARVAPVLAPLAAEGPVAVIAHAGTIRAALATVTGPGAALAFEIAPLSLTRMTAYTGGFAIGCVNARPR